MGCSSYGGKGDSAMSVVRCAESCTSEMDGCRSNSTLTTTRFLGRELEWHDSPAGLEYPFAGRQLGLVPFKARVSTTPWTAIAPVPNDANAVAQLSSASLAQVYSHPVASHLPRIALTHGALRYVARHY